MSEVTNTSTARERKIPRVARTFKLPPALIERYEERAAQLGMNRTAFVERALEAALGGATTAPRVVQDDGPVVAAARAVAPSAPLRPPLRPDALPNRADAFRNRGRS